MKGSVLRALRTRSSLVCLACAACGGQAQAPATSVVAAAKVPVTATSATAVTYRLSDGAPALVLDEQGTRGVLLDNRRFIISRAGAVTLAPMQAPDLMPPVALPARFGGGFLFWNADAVYRARSFNADLEPIAPLPTNAVGFDFGPESILVVAEENLRRQYSLSGKRLPLSPPNVVDFAASDDGRSLAVDAAGKLWASTDAGHTWKGIQPAPGALVRGLRAQASDVWLELDNGTRSSLTPQGALVDAPALPRARPEPNQARAGVDFERIASFGSPLGTGHIAVVTGHQFSIVDFLSGQPSQGPKPIGDPGEQCEALSTQARWLFVCVAEAGRVRVLSGAAEQSPSLERAFEPEPGLWFASGVLLIEAACSGVHEAGHVCVRTSDGRYSDFEVAEAFAKSGVPEPRALHWVPSASGAPVALLSHLNPDGSMVSTVRVSLVPENAVPLDAPLPPLFQERRGQVSTEASSHAYTKHVSSSVAMLADGSLRGLSAQGSFRISASGHVALDSRKFSALGQHAGLAFAQTADRHFFQTLDFGEHWLEVAGPATDSSPAFSYDCSEAGCFLGHWSRLGWPAEPPLVRPNAHPVPAAVSEAAPAAVPDLRCEPLGKPALSVHPAPPDTQQTYDDASDGPGTARGMSGAARASFDRAPFLARDRANRAPKPSSIALSFDEGFDPLGVSRRAALPFADWLAAWKKQERQGERIPSRGRARPILSARVGHSAGLVFNDDRDFAFSASLDGALHPLPAAGPCEFCNGYLDSKGKLWLAVSKASGASALFAADSAKVLFRAPTVYFAPARDGEAVPERQFLPPVLGFAHSDAIAVDSKGALGLLRLPSGAEPPGGDTPALLLRAGSEPIALAPWSTLALADSVECKDDGTGYRALLQTPYPWLTALGYSPHNGNISAIVRWSSSRVCLEALEIPVSFAALHRDPPPQSGGMEPTLVARFAGGSPAAAVILKGRTLEYRQALSCSLASPSHG